VLVDVACAHRTNFGELYIKVVIAQTLLMAANRYSCITSYGEGRIEIIEQNGGWERLRATSGMRIFVSVNIRVGTKLMLHDD
jgi:hypothetical protein